MSARPRRSERMAGAVLRFLPVRATTLYVRLRHGVRIVPPDQIPAEVLERGRVLSERYGWGDEEPPMEFVPVSAPPRRRCGPWVDDVCQKCGFVDPLLFDDYDQEEGTE